jgi:hypothetical protein
MTRTVFQVREHGEEEEDEDPSGSPRYVARLVHPVT